jgi:hypothetical protein
MRGGGRNRRTFLGRAVARCQERGPGGDEQGVVGARERGGECLDGQWPPVRFSVFREFGKVVVEGRVDDTVRCDSSASEAVQIHGRTAMHVGACRDESRRRVRAARPRYLVSCGDQFWTMAELIRIDADVGTAIARMRRDRC